MRAQRCIEADVSGFLERTREVSCLEDRLQHRGSIAGIDAQIAVTKIGRRKQRRSAGKIQDDIATELCAVARRSVPQVTAQRGLRRGKVIDDQSESAEMTADNRDPS